MKSKQTFAGAEKSLRRYILKLVYNAPIVTQEIQRRQYFRFLIGGLLC